MTEKETSTTAERRPADSSDRLGPDPVIIELGERSRTQIRKLRRGGGRIWRDIDGVLSSLRNEGNLPKEAQVVVVVVRERQPIDDEGFCWS